MPRSSSPTRTPGSTSSTPRASIAARTYDETATVRVTREFLDDREGSLAELFGDFV
jgi:hypothetical protein